MKDEWNGSSLNQAAKSRTVTKVIPCSTTKVRFLHKSLHTHGGNAEPDLGHYAQTFRTKTPCTQIQVATVIVCLASS
jgi:hypothetical protein